MASAELLYLRDATWHQCPNVHGLKKYHRASAADSTFAACSSRIVLDDSYSARAANKIPRGLICRKCFPLGAAPKGEESA